MSIELKQLSFAYGGRRAVNGVNHTFEHGITALIGPNGSGKTTLIKLISGALRPAGGSVLLDGKPIAGMTEARRARKLAIVPQKAHLDFDFSVLDLVLMGRQPYLGRFEREREADLQLAREAMRAMGIAELEARNARMLSGGEWQRVLIARALCQDAPVLLMDEPVSSLDIRHQMEVLSVIRSLVLGKHITVVLVLHDLNLAAHYCDTLVLLSGGELVARGAPDTVLTKDKIERVYGIHTNIERDASGQISVRPVYL